MSPLPTPITIRIATGADAASLARLAALDSSGLLEAPVVVAEIRGDLRAAMSLSDGAAIADPFHPSAALVALLRDHIERTRGGTTLRSRLSQALSPGRAGLYRRPPAAEPARWLAA